MFFPGCNVPTSFLLIILKDKCWNDPIIYKVRDNYLVTWLLSVILLACYTNQRHPLLHPWSSIQQEYTSLSNLNSECFTKFWPHLHFVFAGWLTIPNILTADCMSSSQLYIHTYVHMRDRLRWLHFISCVLGGLEIMDWARYDGMGWIWWAGLKLCMNCANEISNGWI